MEYKLCLGCKKTLPITKYSIKDNYFGVPTYYTKCDECRKRIVELRKEKNKNKKAEQRAELKAQGKPTSKYEKKFDDTIIKDMKAANYEKLARIKEKLDVHHKGSLYERQILDMIQSIEKNTAIMIADFILKNGWESVNAIYDEYLKR